MIYSRSKPPWAGSQSQSSFNRRVPIRSNGSAITTKHSRSRSRRDARCSSSFAAHLESPAAASTHRLCCHRKTPRGVDSSNNSRARVSSI